MIYRHTVFIINHIYEKWIKILGLGALSPFGLNSFCENYKFSYMQDHVTVYHWNVMMYWSKGNGCILSTPPPFRIFLIKKSNETKQKEKKRVSFDHINISLIPVYIQASDMAMIEVTTIQG